MLLFLSFSWKPRFPLLRPLWRPKGSLFGQKTMHNCKTRSFFFAVCGWMRVGWVVLFLFFLKHLFFFVSFLKVFVLLFRCHQLLSSFHRISRTQNHMRAAMQVKQIRSRSPQGSQSFWWMSVVHVFVAGYYGYLWRISQEFLYHFGTIRHHRRLVAGQVAMYFLCSLVLRSDWAQTEWGCSIPTRDKWGQHASSMGQWPVIMVQSLNTLQTRRFWCSTRSLGLGL